MNIKCMTISSILLFISISSDAQEIHNITERTTGTSIFNEQIHAIEALEILQHRADHFFEKEQYDLALRDYSMLARVSDKYSQYYLAYMHFHGLGMPENLIEAYAWSYVAAETGIPDYVGFHQAVHVQLNEQQLIVAWKKANEYQNDVGIYKTAIRARKLIARKKQQCTGSRVGATCNRIGRSINTCNANMSKTPSQECLIIGAIDLLGIAGTQRFHLRNVEFALDHFIDENNPIRVELGK